MAGTLRLIAALLALTACERERIQLLIDGGLPIPNRGDTIPGLTALRIEPPSATIISDGRAPGETIDLRAFGRFEDGERDITEEVRWSMSELGTVELGHVVTDDNVGGIAIVRANAGAFEASAEITIRLEVLERTGGVPDDVASRFPDDTSGDAAGNVTLAYPDANTTFPSNIERVRYQWRSTLSSPLYELRFESSIARIRIHTRDPYYQLDALSSGWIPKTHAGRSITMTVRAIEESGGPIQRSDPRVLHFARSEILGTALYWSTTARAIKRASLADPRGVVFLPADGAACVSCHALSRDGTRIAAAFGDGSLRVFGVADPTTPIDLSSNERGYAFGTFSPGGDRLLVAKDGKLVLYDLDGKDSDALELDDGMRATQPDWSPDGRWIAVALARSSGRFSDKNVSGTSIARFEIEQDDDEIEDLDVLVPREEGVTFSFPSYSPDGRFLAFVRTTGSSKDSATSEIQLIAADGSSPVITLAALNGGAANTMPTWAPTTDPSIQWIVFSSTRDYGDVLVGTARDQLWISAIDTDRIAAGSDPSSPAFWVPFQDPEEHNHRALFGPPAPPASNACEPAPETCNGRDDDCDLATDEGCGCAITEICGNGADDDCDERTDSDDEDC